MTKSGYPATGASHALTSLMFETVPVLSWTRVYYNVGEFLVREGESESMIELSLADRISEIKYSPIRRISEKAARLEADGKRIIHFESGRPDFDTPPHIKEAAYRALKEGMVHYAPSSGIPELREAIAESLLQHKGVKYDPGSEIMVTSGGQEALFIMLQALIGPGDEVLVPDPGYGPFYTSITLAGGTAIPIPFRNEKSIAPDLDEAKRLLSERTKAIIINSPHNPTGGVLSSKEVEETCEFAKENNLLVVSDEAYDRILYAGSDYLSPASVQGMKSHVVICGTLSKTYSMTGWRVGYLAGRKEVIGGAIKVHQNVILSVCSFAQAGAVAALRGPQDCVDTMVEEYARRREVILTGIARAPGLSCPVAPLGAFYVFAKYQTPGLNSEAFSDLLVEEAGVAVVPGSGFGIRGEGFLRISYARALEDCAEGMERIVRFMSKHVETA